MSDLIDLNKILSEYSIDDNDFGFSAVSEEEYKSVINESEQSVEDCKRKLTEVEKLIIPFLMKLIKTSDKEYIYWPNRKPAIEAQMKKILSLTRG